MSGTQEVTIFEDGGRLKINLPRQYFGGKQVKKALGLQATPDNWAKAERIARRITLDLQDGQFDETLIKYGVKSNIKLLSSDSLPPKPKLGTLEIWEKYLEYKKHSVKETYFLQAFELTYTPAIEQAIKSVGDEPLPIRNWLLSNRCLHIATRVLSHLSLAYRLVAKQGLISNNPFDGMTQEIPKTKNQKVNVYDDDDDDDLYESSEIKRKAFTVDEVNAILDYVKNSRGKTYYPLLHFLFLTGTRTNEATALMWGDVKWNKGYIVIQRAYSPRLKKFVSTKTGHIRLFPLSKESDLWFLLKSLKEGNPGDLVFPSKTGKPINSTRLGHFWKGVDIQSKKTLGMIPTLIKQGKVSKYLPPYNTRHTFISYQINECDVPPHVVKDWCGHSEKMTTETYRQEDLLTKPVAYGRQATPIQLTETGENEALKQQNLMLIEQNKLLQELLARFQSEVNSK